MANNIIVSQFKTEKGKEAISYNGFSYRYVQMGKDGSLFWRCLDDSCSGRIMTDAQDIQNLQLRTPHNHDPDEDGATVRLVRETLRTRASKELTAIPEIYQQEQLKLAANPNAAARLPPLSSVSSTMYRDRLASMPPLPRTLQGINLPQSFCVTTANNAFLLAQHPQNEYFMFATADNLRCLRHSNTIYMDGTFDVAPALFSQLYTIHAFVSNRLVPLVYVLMADKTAQLYQCKLMYNVCAYAKHNLSIDYDLVEVLIV